MIASTSRRERIDQVSAEILAAQFNRVMSSGYTLLEQGDPEAAIAAFERAANLGVNEEQARAAIAQTETEVANARINAARERIAAAEADEQWQDAVAAYDDVLAIDPNLIFAIEGRDYARKRANLNQLLTYAINNPERFSDDDVFQETVDVYFTGRAIENPGPRLQGSWMSYGATGNLPGAAGCNAGVRQSYRGHGAAGCRSRPVRTDHADPETRQLCGGWQSARIPRSA